MRILPLLSTIITFAATDTACSDPGPGRIVEIVTYRLKQDISIEAAQSAAEETEAFLRETGAVVSRTLSRDDDGLWTDVILWTSRVQAKATEAKIIQRPEFQKFFAMMSEGSVQMRHANVMMQMD